MNPIILPQAKRKLIVGQTRHINLGMVNGLGEGSLWILTCYLPL